MPNAKIALIPAYEPTDTLPAVAEGLAAAGYAVVVVDDGSGPAYADVFRRTGAWAEVISYAPNRGKGYALKAGLAHIAARCPAESVVVTLDSDGQHTVADAERVAAAAAAQPMALTLGVRAFGAGTPARSQFGNSVTRWVYRLATGARVSDTQTGLRAFGAGLLPFLTGIAGDRYEYEMNVLMECPHRGIPLREVPIETIYLNENKGSHFHTFRDSFRVYRVIFGSLFRFAASSLTGFAVDYSLYSLLVTVLSPLGSAVSVPVSNVTARVVSAGTNFAINKHFVFKNRDSVLRTGAQYFLLAACILAGNTVLLSFLVNSLGWNRYAAKLITELTFFTLSWLGQRFWIFRRRRPAAEDPTSEERP